MRTRKKMSEKFFTCLSCQQEHRPEFTDFCRNCEPTHLLCSKCECCDTLPFSQICKICVETAEHRCPRCSIGKTMLLCDGCGYPVCNKHISAYSVVRLVGDKYRFEQLRFCDGF